MLLSLRARPCQELFSESFSRPSRGPRGAPPSGLLPFAAASSVLYAPPARRGRETRPHTGCRQLQRGGAEGMAGGSDGRAASGWRFAPSRMRAAPGGQAREAPNPPGRPTQPHASSCLYIGRKIGPPPGPPAFRAGLLGNRPWSISSTSGRFRLFQYRYGLGTTEHFGRESISAAFGSTMYAQAGL